jgi:hypothetical protein
MNAISEVLRDNHFAPGFFTEHNLPSVGYVRLTFHRPKVIALKGYNHLTNQVAILSAVRLCEC